jgi:hypothetical protein
LELSALQAPDFIALILLIIGLGLSIGQLINLLFRLKINTKAMNDAVLTLVKAGNLERAIKLCDVVPRVPFARGLKGALLAVQSGATDTVSLTMKFNEALGARLTNQPDSYMVPDFGKNRFPALSKILVRIMVRIFIALGFGLAGAAVHYIAGGELYHKIFYGAAGGIFFLFLLSLKEIRGIRVHTTREFARFCDAAQGSASSSLN